MEDEKKVIETEENVAEVVEAAENENVDSNVEEEVSIIEDENLSLKDKIQGIHKKYKEEDGSEEPKKPAVEADNVDDAVEAKEVPANNAEVEDKEAASVYEPNTAYKVHGIEKQFDDKFKGFLKDEESENLVRELYEKADGIDVIKQKRDVERQEKEKIEKEYNNVLSGVMELKECRDSGDLRTLIYDKLQITSKELQQFVHDELVRENLPPEEIVKLQQTDRIKKEYVQQKRENSRLQSDYDSNIEREHERLVGDAMNAPDIEPVAAEYNKRLNNPNAFRNLIQQRGDQLVQSKGLANVTLEEVMGIAVNEVNSLIGNQMPNNAKDNAAEIAESPASSNKPLAANQRNVVLSTGNVKTVDRKKTIANIPGSSESPVEKAPASIAEIKNIYKNKFIRK